MAQNGLVSVARDRMLRDRGALPKEGGDLVREFKAIHEEYFLSSWLREDVESTQERRTWTKGPRRGEQKWRREEEEKNGGQKVFESAFGRQLWGSLFRGGVRDLGCLGGGSCGVSGGSAVCRSAGSLGVSCVFGVLVSPCLVGDLGAFSLSDSDGECVAPQSFSFYRKRRAFLVVIQRDMHTRAACLGS